MNDIFKTKCCYCNKEINIYIPEKNKQLRNHGAFSCNDCVSENSAARDGINESVFVEVKQNMVFKSNRKGE